MRFDSEGRRTYFELDIIALSRDGFLKIGTWDPDQKVVYTTALQDLESQKLVEKLVNKTFIVASRLVNRKKFVIFLYTLTFSFLAYTEYFWLADFQGAPYLMLRESNETLYGNDRFEGYSINLIDEIAKELNFKYAFELVPDGKYGSYNRVTKKWDGLVKQLLDRVGLNYHLQSYFLLLFKSTYP